MPRASFRQRDLTRVLKALSAAGLDILGVNIFPDRSIAVHTGKLGRRADTGHVEVNPWDEVPRHDYRETETRLS